MFPLYGIRRYCSLSVEGVFKVIETAKNRYVLDYKDISAEPCYSARRLDLLREPWLPYNIYPVNLVVNSQDQLIASRHKLFYTDKGQIVRYKPTKYGKIETHSITSNWVNVSNGKVVIVCRGVNTKFELIKYDNEKYAYVLHEGGKEFLLGIGNSEEYGKLRMKV
jgi:hypothetical protein